MGQRAAIYARVSTADQSCERQVSELTAFADRGNFKVVGVFKDTASGTRTNRLARNRIIELAQARKIDAVLVTELGPSTTFLPNFLVAYYTHNIPRVNPPLRSHTSHV